MLKTRNGFGGHGVCHCDPGDDCSVFRCSHGSHAGTNAKQTGKGKQISGRIRKEKRQDFAEVGNIREQSFSIKTPFQK